MADFRTAFRQNFVAVLTGDATLTAALANGSSSIFYAMPPLTVAYPCVSYFVSSMSSDQPGTPRTAWTMTLELTIHATDPDDGDTIEAALETLIESDSFSRNALSDSDVAVGQVDVVGDVSRQLDPSGVARDQVIELRTRVFQALICKAPD